VDKNEVDPRRVARKNAHSQKGRRLSLNSPKSGGEEKRMYVEAAAGFSIRRGG